MNTPRLDSDSDSDSEKSTMPLPGPDFPDLRLDGVPVVSLSPEDAELHSIFHGQFLKYSVFVQGREYLIKPEQKGYEAVAPTEYTCNLIARELGLPVQRFGRSTLDGRFAFVSEQFVTEYIEKHGAATLNHFVKYFPETDLAGWNCERIVAFLQREVSNPQIAIRTFVEVCLFDALVGNSDRHQRNLALIEFHGGAELSPIYDNNSYLAMIPEEDALKQESVFGCIACAHTQSPRLRDYLLEFSRLGLGGVVKAFAARVDFHRIAAIIERSPLSEARKRALHRFVMLRIRELSP